MLKRVRLHGAAGAILWGYRTAAAVRAWRIYRGEDRQWMLTAQVERADAFQLRQGPLLFSAARVGGFWAWPVIRTSVQVANRQLIAKLGPPEQ